MFRLHFIDVDNVDNADNADSADSAGNSNTQYSLRTGAVETFTDGESRNENAYPESRCAIG